MPVSLQKGGNVSLTKEAPGLEKIVIGLGWNPRATDGKDFDLDASVFIVDENGKVLSDQAFVFYGNSTSPDGAIAHLGDNRTGAGDGDDEQITVDLGKVDAKAKTIVVAVTIHDAEVRGQNFGQVGNAFMRVLNGANDAEIARFDLSEDASTETAMVFGQVYRHNDEWKFKAVEQGYTGGLAALCGTYGVDIG